MIVYSFRKKWAAFLQNYRLKKQLTTVGKLLLFVLFIWIFGSLLTILSQWYFAPEYNDSFNDYIKYFWVVIIELVSGFDIPDSIHLHIVSRAISVIMLIMNLTVVALFTGQIISMFNHVLQRADYFPQKPLNFIFRSPILICGFNDKLKDIIMALRKDSLSWKREIVIIDEKADEIKIFEDELEKYNEDVWYVKGNPMDTDILEKAIGKFNNSCIILSEKDQDNKLSDTNAINTALAIESLERKDDNLVADFKIEGENFQEQHKNEDISKIQKIYTILEINDPSNKFHFRRTKINEWICVEDFAMKLISQCAIQNYIHKIFINLMGGNQITYAGNKITIKKLKDLQLNKQKYSDFNKSEDNGQMSIIRETGILIGFVKNINNDIRKKFKLNLRNNNQFIQINPTSKEEIIHHTIKTDYVKYGLFQVIDEGKRRVVFSKDTILDTEDSLIFITKINKLEQKKNKIKTYSENQEDKVDMKSENDNNSEKIMNNVKAELEEQVKFLQNKLTNLQHKEEFSLSKHTIICNWNSKAGTIIEELHDETIGNSVPIVIITPDVSKIVQANNKIFDNVFPIQGDPANEDILKKANIHAAKTVIILADNRDIETADSKSILISLAVDTINPDAHLIVELVNSKNEKFFKYTHVDEIICLEQLAEKLLAQSALTPGLSRVYMDLLTQSADTNEIYIEDVPEQLVGCKYEEAEKAIMSSNKDIILIGFSTIVIRKTHNGFKAHDKKGNLLHGRRIIINPSKEQQSEGKSVKGFSTNYDLSKDDQLFMISYDKPYINFVLKLDKYKKSEEPVYLHLKNSDSIISGKINEIHSGSVEISVTDGKIEVYKYKDIIDVQNKLF